MRIVRGRIGQIEIVYVSFFGIVRWWFVGDSTQRRRCVGGGLRLVGGECLWIAFDVDDCQVWWNGRCRLTRATSAGAGRRVGRLLIDRAKAIDNFEAILLGGGFLGVSISGHKAGRMANAIDDVDGFGFGDFFDVASDVFLKLKKKNNGIRKMFNRLLREAMQVFN